MLGADIQDLGSSTLQQTAVCVAYQLFQAKINRKGREEGANVIADCDALMSVPEFFLPLAPRRSFYFAKDSFLVYCLRCNEHSGSVFFPQREQEPFVYSKS